jgi:hypothetical protein
MNFTLHVTGSDNLTFIDFAAFEMLGLYQQSQITVAVACRLLSEASQRIRPYTKAVSGSVTTVF